MPETLLESTWGEPDGGMKVDREKGVIRDVKCLGNDSVNDRHYTDQAKQDAKGFYEGITVNIDHPAPGNAHHERGMAEGFGVLRNARVLKDGVYADLHYLKKHHLADVITERAERMPDLFGLSHNATGSVREGDKGVMIVEGLEAVESVDIVSRPATTAGLFESHGRDHVFKKKTKPTVRSILEEAKDNDSAVKFLTLLEEEAFAATADAEVDVDQGASSEDTIKAAFRAMVIAAFDDPKLDLKATLSRMKEIMKSQEKLTAKKDEKPDAGDKPGEKPDAAMESIQARLDEGERKDAVRDLLEDHDLRRRDLKPFQRKMLEAAAADSEEAMEELLEGFNIKPARNGQQRPAIGSARLREEKNEPTSYADCRESVQGKPAKKGTVA